MGANARLILAVQGARALAYGLGSVLIGVKLADRGHSGAAVGLLLASLLAGSAATLAGSAGALIALVGTEPEYLLAYPTAGLAGLIASTRLSPAVERGDELQREPLPPRHRSRGIVARLSGLFALDSFAGGFVPQTFVAYLFAASTALRRRRSRSSSSRSGSCRRSRSRQPFASRSGSGCSAPWCSRTCPRTCFSLRSLSPPT